MKISRMSLDDESLTYYIVIKIAAGVGREYDGMLVFVFFEIETEAGLYVSILNISIC